MGCSFAVWNIEKFKYNPQRVRAVGQLIAKHDPDVIGILEFLDKNAARRLVRSEHLAGYDFAFTDSARSIEILVGWRRGKFDQVLYTQRRELQAGNVNLRPGGLLSVLPRQQEVFTNFLFLHTDSGKDAQAFANRKLMLEKVWGLQERLGVLAEQQGEARLIVLGDLNTMGQTNGATAAEEIAALAQAALANGMRVLPKTHPHTWSSDGVRKSNLDHVMASSELRFKAQTPAPTEVLVDGWVNRSGEDRVNFVKNISDHSLLFGELV
jgi:endonuclease/exonuclease/phosphatase family metal-dependent hydrolase